MLGFGPGDGRAGLPGDQPSPGLAVPGERPERPSLAEPVHLNRAVPGRAAKVSAPTEGIRVAACPRVDHELLAPEDALDGEKVGMSMAAAVRTTERPDVEDHLLGIGSPPAPKDGR